MTLSLSACENSDPKINMPPRAVTLATSGKALTGPPEGYNKKKERIVKKWLTDLPADVERNLVAESSIMSMPQVRCA